MIDYNLIKWLIYVFKISYFYQLFYSLIIGKFQFIKNLKNTIFHNKKLLVVYIFIEKNHFDARFKIFIHLLF